METIFYVVRTTYCEYIYGSLKDAKAIAAVMLDTHSARVVIIERYEMVRDGCQLFTEQKIGAKLLLDTANKRAMVTIQDHVIFGELTEKLHDQYTRRLVTAQGLRGLMGSLNRLLDAKYSKMNNMRKSMWGERANQRLLKVPTITVNQTSHTDGMFDLCVESDIYTTMLARLVRVEGVKVPSADNTGNETDKN